MRILQIAELELGAQKCGRTLRLRRAHVHVAPPRRGKRQDVQDVATGAMLGQRSAATDLDIVGVRADCEDAPLLLLATVAHRLGEQQGLLHELGRCHGFEEQAIDAAFDGLPHELRAVIVRDDERCQPAVVRLDPLQAVEIARQPAARPP
jgi:hypothetical protein